MPAALAAELEACLKRCAQLAAEIQAAVGGAQDAERKQTRNTRILRRTADRVLAVLAEQNQRITVSGLKALTATHDMWVAPALALLRQEGKADHIPGPRNAQMWAATTKADPAASVGNCGIAE